jgi:Transposase
VLVDVRPVEPAAPTLQSAGVLVGIDAAITANHSVAVRRIDGQGSVVTTRFVVAPTLAGLGLLTRRLSAYPGVVAVAEPTSMTWLPLALALQAGGGRLCLLGSRHAARLRGAISAKNKSDVIDADVLARAGEVFDLHPLELPGPAQLALRRACTRRAGAVLDANRCLRRLISLARWAFPDVWNAFAGSLPTAKAVLGRWPHLDALAAARRSALTGVVAEHTRGVPDVPARVEAIRAAARNWARFWDGHLDLDALAAQASSERRLPRPAATVRSCPSLGRAAHWRGSGGRPLQITWCCGRAQSGRRGRRERGLPSTGRSCRRRSGR